MSVKLPPGVPLFDADGALSREFLLHRGYCCGNGCRNCPYGESKSSSAARSTPTAASTVPAAPVDIPRRIVSLCPSNTELLAALDLLPRVVGVDDWSDWPPEIQTLPRVGPDLDIDMDRVVALRPDLVLASLSVPGMERNVSRLQELGLPHLTLDPHGVEDIWDHLRLVARVAGVETRAETLIATLQRRIERVQHRVRVSPSRPRLYWEWWPKPLFAPGRRNWLTQLSELAGAVNVTGHVDADAARPTPDEIRAADPDYILLVWTGVARHKVRPDVLLRRPGWDQLRAVREGRIHVLEEGLFCRPSPRLIDGLEHLAALIHPELRELKEPRPSAVAGDVE